MNILICITKERIKAFQGSECIFIFFMDFLRASSRDPGSGWHSENSSFLSDVSESRRAHLILYAAARPRGLNKD